MTNQTITATSNSGTEFTLTASHLGVKGEAKGISLGDMQIIRDGKIEATFPQQIGGRSVRVGAEFSAAEWAKVAALYAWAEGETKQAAAEDNEYDRHYRRVMSTD